MSESKLYTHTICGQLFLLWTLLALDLENFSEVCCFDKKYSAPSLTYQLQNPCGFSPLFQLFGSWRLSFSLPIPISRQSSFLLYAMFLSRYLHLADYLPRPYLHLSSLQFRPRGMVPLRFYGYGCTSCIAMFLINPILLPRIVKIIHGDPSLRASYRRRMLGFFDGH